MWKKEPKPSMHSHILIVSWSMGRAPVHSLIRARRTYTRLNSKQLDLCVRAYTHTHTSHHIEMKSNKYYWLWLSWMLQWAAAAACILQEHLLPSRDSTQHSAPITFRPPFTLPLYQCTCVCIRLSTNKLLFGHRRRFNARMFIFTRFIRKTKTKNKSM